MGRRIQPPPELQRPARGGALARRRTLFQAGYGGRLAFHIMKNIADVDLFRRMAQPITAALAFAGAA